MTLVYVGVVCSKWMVPKFQTHQSGCTTFSWHSSVSLLLHSKVVSRRQESYTFMDLVPCLGPCYLAIWWQHAGGSHPTEDPALRVTDGFLHVIKLSIVYSWSSFHHRNDPKKTFICCCCSVLDLPSCSSESTMV